MLDVNGRVLSIGNNYGNFGVGTSESSITPVEMQDPDGNVLYGVKQIATGERHIVVVKADGSVWTAGNNSYGQLGLGTTTESNVLKKVSQTFIGVKSIFASGYSTYIIDDNDKLYVCGYNNYGELFTGDKTKLTSLKAVQQNKNILTIGATKSSSSQTSCIVTTDGMVYTAGYNGYGQIGDYTTRTTLEVTEISDIDIRVEKNIIDLKVAGDTAQINYTLPISFNLKNDTLPTSTITYSSLDENVATVDENGKITSVGIGTTFIKVHENTYDVWDVVKVNVNGEQGNTHPKVVGGKDHYIALKADGSV